MGIVILIVVAILAVIYYMRTRGAGGGRKKSALWEECRRLLKLPPEEADKTIERHLDSLRSKYPDRSEEWYLEKIIYDLERDR